jgi:hypothetical protein
LSFGDNCFPRLQPLRHDDRVAGSLPDRDRTLFNCGVRLHYEHVLAILSGLYRLARHDDRVFKRVEPQRHARKLPWPQTMIGVWECGFQLDRVGGDVDGVVEKRERSGYRLRIAILGRSCHR